MALVFINETTLTAIADAIREKRQNTNTYLPSEMADAILRITTGTGGVILAGDISDTFKSAVWNNALYKGDVIVTTEDVTSANNLCKFETTDSFHNSFYLLIGDEGILPFTEVNCAADGASFDYAFADVNVKTCPIVHRGTDPTIITGMKGTFKESGITDITPFFGSNDIQCHNYDETFYSSQFREISNFFPVAERGTSGTETVSATDMFKCSTFLKKFTFATNGGTPYDRTKVYTFGASGDPLNYTVTKDTPWIGTVLDLSQVGFCVGTYSNGSINYINPGAADKEITDASTYAALKNDPDAWTKSIEYALFNKTSAIQTINSLPDVRMLMVNPPADESHWPTDETGLNCTIKFYGAAGASTDGGYIGGMTESQLAVATAKGWTVAYA